MAGRVVRSLQAVGAWLADRPWTHWAIAYAVLVLFYLVDRCVGVDALVEMYGNESDAQSAGTKTAVVAFGLLEDVVCATYFVFFLWLADLGLRLLSRDGQRWVALTKALRFVWYFALFVIFAAPFAADVLLVRYQQFRFTYSLITTAIAEKDNASGLATPGGEIGEGYATAAAVVAVGVVFAVFGACWLDLSAWNPFAWVIRIRWPWLQPSHDSLVTPVDSDSAQGNPKEHSATDGDSESGAVEMMENGEHTYTALETPSDGKGDAAALSQSGADARESSHDGSQGLREKWERALELLCRRLDRVNWRHIAVFAACATICLVVFPIVVMAIADHAVSPLVATAGLNSTLNELFEYFFGASFIPDMVDGTIESAALYLDSDTEKYQLVSNDSLYRTTFGYRGELAFDVKVNSSDPPNVLVLVVESFRYYDSQYLLANNTYLLKDENITVTPEFDRWAKRGIGFHNFWSSWRTSRSVESILFGQLPYDSVMDSGTTGGREDVELSGMPQLFASKGYSTKFTTGCILDYDGWDTFFESHGFDEVLGDEDIREIAERDLGISSDDWKLVCDGGKARAMAHWGVHDDVALEVLGNILVNETANQRKRVTQGEPKKPVFINHYTISSHTPYQDRPQWYDEMSKPDFSALYNGEEYAEDIKNYLEMRYFTDMAIGKFLDRMEEEGVLNDTIVVITGDHGQAPEWGLGAPEDREVSVTRVAATLIAEGRLGEHAGMLFTDAAEQYDLLSTLADIVGVPDAGFVQDGVGRSLKRKYQSSKPRQVYSNNPSRKLSIVIGNERLQYDARSNAVVLHNVETDHDLEHNLFLSLTETEQREWRKRRDDGRRLNGYFKKRWDGECLLSATC